MTEQEAADVIAAARGRIRFKVTLCLLLYVAGFTLLVWHSSWPFGLGVFLLLWATKLEWRAGL